MTDVLWPPDLVPSSQSWRQIGNAGTFVSPLSGATKTYGRPGVRMGCVITLPPVNGSNRARMQAVLGALRDRGNRIWMPDFTSPDRGSFPATELLTNNDFASGTTGWTATNGALTVADRVARLTASLAASFEFSRSATVTQYAPHALRAMVTDGAQSAGLTAGPYMSDGTTTINGTGTSRGLRTAAFTPISTTVAHYPITVTSATGFTAGAYMECQWSSAARCPLVDGGGNLLTYSDQIDNAAWTKNAVAVDVNSGVAPDGTSTAEFVAASASTAQHYIYQTATVSASAADYCLCVAVKRTGYDYVWLDISNGTTSAYQVFNLNSGAVGSSSGTGANFSNLRSFIVNMGGGWYACCIVVRKTNSATTLYAQIGVSSTDSNGSFLGDAASGSYVWRATLAQSSVPVRLTQSTSAAVSASTQTGGGIYVKGLPASTSGLLLVGKMVQIGTQINRVIAALDSDAAGRGYLLCANPWRTATNDAPVIINTPMCRMIPVGDIDIETGPAQFSPFQIELEEAVE